MGRGGKKAHTCEFGCNFSGKKTSRRTDREGASCHRRIHHSRSSRIMTMPISISDLASPTVLGWGRCTSSGVSRWPTKSVDGRSRGKGFKPCLRSIAYSVLVQNSFTLTYERAILDAQSGYGAEICARPAHSRGIAKLVSRWHGVPEVPSSSLGTPTVRREGRGFESRYPDQVRQKSKNSNFEPMNTASGRVQTRK